MTSPPMTWFWVTAPAVCDRPTLTVILSLSVMTLTSQPSKKMPLQLRQPGLQDATPQLPITQLGAPFITGKQERPQLPQLFGSKRGSTHMLLQVASGGPQPGLATVLVGADPGSQIYEYDLYDAIGLRNSARRDNVLGC